MSQTGRVSRTDSVCRDPYFQPGIMRRARPALAKFKRCRVKNGSDNEYGSNDFTLSQFMNHFSDSSMQFDGLLSPFICHIEKDRSTH